MDIILKLKNNTDDLELEKIKFSKLKKQIEKLLKEVKIYINENSQELKKQFIVNQKILNITSNILEAVNEMQERAKHNCGLLLESVIMEDYEKNNMYLTAIDFDNEKDICFEIYSLLKDTFDIEKNKKSVEKCSLILTTSVCLENLNKTINSYLNVIDIQLEFLNNLNTETK